MPRPPPSPQSYRAKQMMIHAHEATRTDRSHQWVLRRVRRSVEAARGVIARRSNAGAAR